MRRRSSGNAYSAARVVGVGAICDFKSGPPRWGQSLHFSIKEYVVLEGGRHVVLDERGYNSSTGRALMTLEDGQRVVLENAFPAGAGETLDRIRHDVPLIAFADDDDLGEEQHWADLAQRAWTLGIVVTADELQVMGYRVILTKRVIEWLEPARAGVNSEIDYEQGRGPYSGDANRSMENPNPSDLTRYSGSGRVVGIGAICDFESAPPMPGLPWRFAIKEIVVLEDGRRVVVDEHDLNQLHSVRQVVDLEDGRRVLLDNVNPLGAGLAPDYIRQDVLNVVLPDDDAEALQEAHPWPELAQRARRLGIEVTADELKALDYQVILTERVVQSLS